MESLEKVDENRAEVFAKLERLKELVGILEQEFPGAVLEEQEGEKVRPLTSEESSVMEWKLTILQKIGAELRFNQGVFADPNLKARDVTRKINSIYEEMVDRLKEV